MSKSCEAAIAQTGVLVETWSGRVDEPPICSLSGQSDIRHFVRVLNLRLHPADVKCVGAITSEHRLIEFSCDNSSGPEATWQESLKGLGDGTYHTFGPCTLQPVSEADGTETINAEITISWPISNKKRTIPLSIEVHT